MEDYTHLSDEQLQSLAASGDSAAEELLADRFSSLAQLIAQSYHIAGAAARWKHTPLNNGVSLEETLTAPKRDTNARILSEQRRTPEEQVLARESAEEFSDSFSRLLSPFEQSVIRLYLDGYSYRAMACRLDRDEKSIDNAVQRIRRKLARIYSSGDFSES